VSYYRSVAASVAQAKERHPEQFCPTRKCLWRTGGGKCPRHGGEPKAAAKPRWTGPVGFDPNDNARDADDFDPGEGR
jgi:hypothetical protein